MTKIVQLARAKDVFAKFQWKFRKPRGKEAARLGGQ